MDNYIKLSKQDIVKKIGVLEPYIYVYEAECLSGKCGKGYTIFPRSEWFFDCHFPNKPVVPGVFQLESLMQLSSLVLYVSEDIETTNMRKIENAIFYEYVKPDEKMYIEINIDSFRRGIIKSSGETYVIRNEQKILTCRASFELILPNYMVKLSPQKG